METPPTPAPIVVRTQGAIDALTAAAFAAAVYATCACGSVIDERGATACYPCRTGNRRAWLYGGRTARIVYAGRAAPLPYDADADAVAASRQPPERGRGAEDGARIAALERAVAYWRDRARTLAGYGALGAGE